jgi:hypothetical protein
MFWSWSTEECSSICMKGSEIHMVCNQNIFELFICLFNFMSNDAINNSDCILLITGWQLKWIGRDLGAVVPSFWVLTDWVTNTVDLRPFWEATSCAALREFDRNLWNPNVHYRVHKRHPPSLSWTRSLESIQSNPTSHDPFQYYHPTYVSFFLVVSFLLVFQPKSYMQSYSPHSCYIPRLSHPPWLDLSDCTWWRVPVMKFSLCSFLQTLSRIPLQSKYSPPQPLLRYRHSMFIP